MALDNQIVENDGTVSKAAKAWIGQRAKESLTGEVKRRPSAS